MKKLKKLANSYIFALIIWILIFPFEMIYHVYYYFTDIYFYRARQLGNLLKFGKPGIGGYIGKLKILTSSGIIIYDGERSLSNNAYLNKMKVCRFWVENDVLFVEVFGNEKLIKKYQTSLIVLQIKERLKK